METKVNFLEQRNNEWFFSMMGGSDKKLNPMGNIQLDHNQHTTNNIKYPLSILAHDIAKPWNVGSIFRIADAFGIEKIYLSGSSPVPPNDKIRKTSRATDTKVPYNYEDNPIDLVVRLKSEGYTILSLEITSSSIDIGKLSISKNEKILLILGSEKSGGSQDLLNISDKTVHIPMAGINSSMNVAVACGIACWEIIREK